MLLLSLVGQSASWSSHKLACKKMSTPSSTAAKVTGTGGQKGVSFAHPPSQNKVTSSDAAPASKRAGGDRPITGSKSFTGTIGTT